MQVPRILNLVRNMLRLMTRYNLRRLCISGRPRFDVTLRIIEDTNVNGNMP